MHYSDQGYQATTYIICFLLSQEIHDINGQSELTNVTRATQGMVHCHLSTAQPDPIYAIEDCVLDRRSGDRNEARILADWKNQCVNDADSIATA